MIKVNIYVVNKIKWFLRIYASVYSNSLIILIQCAADSECCVGLICNPWAGRCTKPKVTTTKGPSTGGAE